MAQAIAFRTIAVLCLCLFFFVGVSYAGGGAKKDKTIKRSVEGWMRQWVLNRFSLPTSGGKTASFVVQVAEDIRKHIRCDDEKGIVYTSIFGGNLCFDYLVVRVLQEHFDFRCKFTIHNIDLIGPSAEAQEFIAKHIGAEIVQYKDVYDFVEQVPSVVSDVIISTQPQYISTTTNNGNPAGSQVLQYITTDDTAAIDAFVARTKSIWDSNLKTDKRDKNEPLTLNALCLASPGPDGKAEMFLRPGGSDGLKLDTAYECLQRVEYGLLSLLDKISTKHFKRDIDNEENKGWIFKLGRRLETEDNVHHAYRIVRGLILELESRPDLVVPCFVDECVVYRSTASSANENVPRYAATLKYVVDALKDVDGEEGSVLSNRFNLVVQSMAGRENPIPNQYRFRKGDMHIALYDVIATTSIPTHTTRAYILRGLTGELVTDSVLRHNWQGLVAKSAKDMKHLLKETVIHEYSEKPHFELQSEPSEDVKELSVFIPESAAVVRTPIRA